MTLRLNQMLMIEDLRNHSPEIVEKLRQLLGSGTPATADPHRSHFYEVQNCSEVFYIHVSPNTGKVYLLATWKKDPEPAAATPPVCPQSA